MIEIEETEEVKAILVKEIKDEIQNNMDINKQSKQITIKKIYKIGRRSATLSLSR